MHCIERVQQLCSVASFMWCLASACALVEVVQYKQPKHHLTRLCERAVQNPNYIIGKLQTSFIDKTTVTCKTA